MSYDDITTTLKYSNDEDVSEDDTVNYQEIDNNTEVSSGLDETSTMMNYQEYCNAVNILRSSVFLFAKLTLYSNAMAKQNTQKDKEKLKIVDSSRNAATK